MNKNYIFIFKISLFSLALVTIFTNCMPSGFVTINELSLDQTNPSLLEENPAGGNRPIITLNLMSANQLFQSLLNLNELSDDTNAIRNEFNIRRSAFTDVGKQSGMNAPYLLSLTSLSGAVCHESITQKKGIFKDIDLSQRIAELSDDSYLSFTNRLFRQVTLRDMDKEEEDLFRNFKNDFLATGQTDSSAQHRQLWVSTCSAVMSHLKTITY